MKLLQITFSEANRKLEEDLLNNSLLQSTQVDLVSDMSYADLYEMKKKIFCIERNRQ